MFRNLKLMGRWIAIALGIGLVCCAQASAKKPPPEPEEPSGGYTIIPFAPDGVQFDSNGIFGLNDAGDVVGVVGTADGQSSYHLDLDTGTYTPLPGRVWSLNGYGDIVGTVSANDETTDGYYLSAPGAEPVLLTPLLEGDLWVYAYGINDLRVIVGCSAGTSGVTAVIWRPILNEDGTWSVDGPVPLLPLDGDTSSEAIDINDPIAGGPFEILGSSDSQAVIWTVDLNADGTLSVPSDAVSLGTFDGAPVRGYAINSWGDICGSSSPSLPIYRPFDGPVQSLNVVRNTSWGRAMDVNDLGQCVGQIETVSRSNAHYLSAYFWERPDADPIDLKKLIDKDSGWSLSYANYINNNGAIAGNGYYNGVQTWAGFIMVPAP